MTRLIQPSFAKGEIAPALYGRIDTAAYAVALKKARNCLVHAFGGISNRPGTIFVGPVNTHTDEGARLIPFKFSNTDTYILEFGDFYMRVIRSDAHVTETALTGCTATAADPVVVTKTTHGFSTDDEVYCSGFTEMTELNGKRFKITVLTADTFSLQDQVTGTDIDGSAYTAETTGGSVARIYTVTTPYAVADLAQLTYTQSADVMTLTHRSYPVQELTRTDHDAWTMTEAAFNPTTDYPDNVAATTGSGRGTTYSYKVTAIAEDGEESLSGLDGSGHTITAATAANPVVVTSASHGFNDGDEVYISGVVGMTELNDRRFFAASTTTNTFALTTSDGDNIDGSGYTAYTSGGTIDRCFDTAVSGASTVDIDLAWDPVVGAVKYAVYRQDNGLYGLVGETELPTFTDDNIEPDTSLTPPRYVEVFNKAGDYPQAVGYYEQRRVFGGSTNEPDTSRYSVTGNHSNFTKSIPIQSDDSITATLSAEQVNAIRHYVPGNDLLILTSGQEWKVNSGQDSGFGVDTLKQKPQTTWGSSYVKPITQGGTTLFVQENGAALRSIGYSLQIDGYTGSNISLLASHMLRTHTIIDGAFSRHPDPICTFIRDDGTVLCLTFDQEQEIVAWTTWDTDGYYEAVASIRPDTDTPSDYPYFIVKRKINGNTVRYIERLASREFEDVRDAFFVDCGLSLDSPVTITDATSASPVVITAAGHGFSNGDEVDIFDIVWEYDEDSLGNQTQPDQLNTRRYVVANKTTDTFELTDSNGDDIDGSAFNDYVSGGTARKVVSSISGLDHLEGENVVALSDGNVISSLTVASGAVTLPRGASRIHIGLKFIADVQTLDLVDPGNTRSNTQGLPRKIPKVTLRFERSRGVFVGPTTALLTEMKQREFEAYGDPTALLTGDKAIDLQSDWNTDGTVFVRQKNPLPMTLLAIIPEMETGDF